MHTLRKTAFRILTSPASAPVRQRPIAPALPTFPRTLRQTPRRPYQRRWINNDSQHGAKPEEERAEDTAEEDDGNKKEAKVPDESIMTEETKSGDRSQTESNTSASRVGEDSEEIRAVSDGNGNKDKIKLSDESIMMDESKPEDQYRTESNASASRVGEHSEEVGSDSDANGNKGEIKLTNDSIALDDLKLESENQAEGESPTSWDGELPPEVIGHESEDNRLNPLQYSDYRLKRKSHSPYDDPRRNETVYIGNLFFDVTADDLRYQMEKYGTVERVVIVLDSRGLSKGYGYVTYDSIEAAARAIEGMNFQIFEGRNVIVDYSFSGPSVRRGRVPRQRPTKTLFVGNMGYELTDRDLQDIFKDVENVVDVRVTVDRRTGQLRGFVHAEFLDVPSAQMAFDVLSRKAPYGRELYLDYTSYKGVERDPGVYYYEKPPTPSASSGR